MNSPACSLEEYNAQDLISLTLTQRQLCDLELLLNGGFSPLKSFLNQSDYMSVLDSSRLTNGLPWTIPIILDVDSHFVKSLQIDQAIALRDSEGLLLAIFKVTEWWEVDKMRESFSVFGTDDPHHPGVSYLFNQTKNIYLGGDLIGISLPHHYDFKYLRHTPAKIKKIFDERGWKKIVAFQTRNPMHRAHQELTLRAAEKTNANILLHPVVGMTKPGDFEYYTRVRCYEHVYKTYNEHEAFLSLLPLAMRMAGPKEAVWHAIIRKNYGCTHFIVGRDHAGPGRNAVGQNFYDPYAAQTLAMQYAKEIGIEIVPFQEMVFSQQQQRYFPIEQFPSHETPARISGTELRTRISKNLDVPEWFSYPAVIRELRAAHIPKNRQGFTVFFTGLPSSGKSTLAHALALKIRELTNRQISLLDGDIIRSHLSQDLGFSKQDRETNITRVAFVAREITKHGGIALCALVSPYIKIRQKVRQMIEEVGGFIEVYVATPLIVCEKRDRKGLYRKAREGLIHQFTGISDPYEIPMDPEIKLDTENKNPDESVMLILKEIKKLGYVNV